MSRVGKSPISIPEGVKVDISDKTVNVSGKLGKLSMNFPQEVQFVNENNVITVKPVDDSNRARAMWGLSRTLLNNMVVGVSQGFEEKLEIVGVGYRAAVEDDKYLNLSLGYSHEVKFEIPEGITIKAAKPTSLSIFGYDKQKVGQIAAMIIKQRPPEPYKGKGINYEGRKIRRKEGKKK